MPPLTVSTASLRCSFGAATMPLTAIGSGRVTSSSLPAATVMDMAPVANVPSFVSCAAPTNPAVISAAGGTPPPCVPVITGPWTPGSPTVFVGGVPALNATSTCMCTWAGVITVVVPGQTTVSVA